MKTRWFAHFVLALILMSALTLPTQERATGEPSQPLMFDGRIVLSSLMSLVDGRISHIADTLAVAALTEEVRSSDWTRMKPLLAEVQKREGAAIVWYALPDGSYFTVDKDKTNQTLKDRPYFPKVLAGQVVIGDLVVSKSTGQMSTIIAVPVKHGKSVTGILGVSLFMQKLSGQITRDMGLPDEVIFYAFNRDRMTAFHAKIELVFADPTAQGSESLTRAVHEMLSKDQGIVEYDFGGPRRVMFRRSDFTGWWYALGMPIGH
jgi:methyl-accepting chemotaxis protein